MLEHSRSEADGMSRSLIVCVLSSNGSLPLTCRNFSFSFRRKSFSIFVSRRCFLSSSRQFLSNIFLRGFSHSGGNGLTWNELLLRVLAASGSVSFEGVVRGGFEIAVAFVSKLVVVVVNAEDIPMYSLSQG